MSAFFDNIRVALLGLRGNKLRSALTMLGITIGVSAVIVLVSVGQAVEVFVREEFEEIGSNLLFLLPFDEQGEFTRITQDEVKALADPFRVPDASLLMPQRGVSRSVTSEGREIQITVQGITPVYPFIFSREVAAGRFIDQNDVDSASRVAVLGQGTVEQLFPDTFPIGQSIRVGGVRLDVIGVLDPGSEFGPPGSGNNAVLVPITTAQTRLAGDRGLSGDRPVDFVVIQARDSDNVDAAARQVQLTLREERDIAFREEDSFQVLASNDLLDTFQQITGLITVFLGVLAGISLLVGGIGIMNIMLVTVTERTREIGLRKAVGARNGDILLQFLTEATVLSLIGGAVGVFLAFLAAQVLSLIPDLDVQVQASSVLLATLISATIGILFGVFPANRAAGLNPIDALRYE